MRENEPERAARLGGKLQPPALGKAEAIDLAKDGAKAAMPQPLFHRLEHGPGISGLDEDQPVGVQAGPGEARGEEIPPGEAPEDRSAGAGEDAGREQCGGRWRASGRDLVHGGAGEPAGRQRCIDCGEAEGKSAVRRPAGGGAAFKLRDALAQLCDFDDVPAYMPLGAHVLSLFPRRARVNSSDRG